MPTNQFYLSEEDNYDVRSKSDADEAVFEVVTGEQALQGATLVCRRYASSSSTVVACQFIRHTSLGLEDDILQFLARSQVRGVSHCLLHIRGCI